MPAACNDSFKLSRLNCGLCLERGTVRMSITRVTPCAWSRRINSPMVRVEWPTVKTVGLEFNFGGSLDKWNLFLSWLGRIHVFVASNSVAEDQLATQPIPRSASRPLRFLQHPHRPGLNYRHNERDESRRGKKQVEDRERPRRVFVTETKRQSAERRQCKQ